MNSTSRVRRLRAITVLALLAGTLVVLPAPATVAAGPTVFINEIHYDNTGTDAGEAIEVAGPAGTDLTGWTVVLYNGATGLVYDTDSLAGTIVDQQNGFGTVSISYPSNGIQNGAPDGIALVDAASSVVQFLSYEGTLTAIDGPAMGTGSTDIGVAEAGTEPLGQSLQLTGTGAMYGDFTWTAPQTATLAGPNTGQTFTGSVTPPVVVINEVDYDQASTDAAEFVELMNVGSTSADLTGWTLELVNGTGGGAVLYDTIVLPAVTLAAGDYYVVCANAATVGNCDLDDSPDTNFIQNGAPDAVGLRDATASLVDAVSYEGDSGAPYTEGSGTGLVDDAAAAAIGISRFPDGVDTDVNNIDLSARCITPGLANSGDTSGCSTPAVCTVVPVDISVVQGSGDVTPCGGQIVTVEGVVVGDYEGPSPELRGFYVQEEDADNDADPVTSEGIFVFNGDTDSVALGDLVRVTGTAVEFQGQTQLGSVSSVTVLGSGQVVTAASPSLPVPASDHFERYEGMLATFTQPLYVTEHFQLGRFGQVVVSSGDRLDQPTAVAEPGAAANAVQTANNLNRLIVDDDLNNQNPDPILFGRGGAPLTAANTLRGGDVVTGIVGVMTYTWSGNSASGNAYRLRPVGDLSDTGLVAGGGVPVFGADNPRPATAPSVGGSLTVASFNVLNYFLTLDDGGLDCGPLGFPQECRGAEDAAEFARQRTKLLAALAQLDADIVGLIELENTEGVEPLADIVAGLNDLAGAGTYDYVATGTIGSDVIKVGIIYKPGSVTPLGVHAILDSTVDPLFDDELHRPVLAQSFVEVATGEAMTVVVNHLKSKGCTDATGLDLDQGDGAGCFNAARTAGANAEVAWLATDPTGAGDPDVLVIGDMNSYNKESPIDVFVAGGYANLVEQYGGTDAYSYVFDGQWGYLDYALASPSLVAQVTGNAEYHINADEPSVLDYNTNFKSVGQVTSLHAPDEFRASDHDPVVVGVGLDAVGAVVTATPSLLWPPNHKYRTVTMTAVDSGGAPLTVDILVAVSSEADAGLGPDDVPIDIVITGPATVRLRAERFALEGRTYTITAYVTSASGQTQLVTATVLVPHDLGP